MRQAIEDVVTKMFVYNDEHNWKGLAAVFAPEVKMLHKLEGNEEEHTMTPEQIVNAWRPIMEKFDSVHHQIGNFLIREINDEHAVVSCYGTSTHYKPNSKGSIWEVVGDYEFTLHKENEGWKIAGEVFNCKYQSGNLELH
ncbi:MAG: nuclear transport factor 2 family protein [Carboxylicivirga sp.]|jgi:3-phenylpropionate/cinnamic acid dioxygenase small subunit|nr:nuclear transport factor 2 family protein [Carboxylicivirga sp.]